MKYHFIRDHSCEHSIRTMCRVLNVSHSGYYAWRGRPRSSRALANESLLASIRRIHERYRENYGAVKTWRALLSEGVGCGRHRVARLRRLHGIEAKRRRRFRSAYLARNSEPSPDNLLDRDFTAHEPNRVWVGDATFIPTREGWLYLAALIDLYSRKVVGWAMSSQLNRQLVIDALMMAIKHRSPAPGLIHHTDQGVVYATSSYRAVLNQHGMVASMSRKGNCLDNAVAESFFSNLKNELTWHHGFQTRAEARTAVFDYIELFYNRQRIHQTLDYVSPVAYERQVTS